MGEVNNKVIRLSLAFIKNGASTNLPTKKNSSLQREVIEITFPAVLSEFSCICYSLTMSIGIWLN